MDLNQVIQEELAGSNKPESTPLKVAINGQEITFTSVDELNRNLNEALTTVGSEYQQMKARLAELEAARGQTVVEDDTPVDTGKFSQDRFLDLLKTDPVSAFDYVDQHRYGMEKPTEYIKNNLKQSEETRQEYEVNRWLQRHPEFPGGQHAQVLDNIRMRLNLPLNAQNLEIAYQQGIQNGLIPDFKTIAYLNQYKQTLLSEIQQKGGQLPPEFQTQVPQSNQTQVPWNGGAGFNPSPAPPPRLPGGGNSGSPIDEAALDQLSVEQIEKILSKFGMK